MNSSDFGIWAMLAFWGSAFGGILLGLTWAKVKPARKKTDNNNTSSVGSSGAHDQSAKAHTQ